jgi:hypothetical protein
MKIPSRRHGIADRRAAMVALRAPHLVGAGERKWQLTGDIVLHSLATARLSHWFFERAFDQTNVLMTPEIGK